MKRRTMYLWILVVLAALPVLLIQFVPYGRAHANPPLVAEPAWDTAQTRQSFMAACGDCHSNETLWPWYSNVAPASWLVQRDVEEGRAALNVSEWGRPENEGDHAAHMVREGEMPPAAYRMMHSGARLSDAKREALIAGLVATFGDHEHGGESEEGE